jgi:hypothetical protein
VRAREAITLEFTAGCAMMLGHLGGEGMYQVEVKRYAVEHLFPPSAGWRVVVDLDGMELGKGGHQAPDKQVTAATCMEWFRQHNVRVMKDEEFGRRDIVARHPDHGTVLVEVEGKGKRQPEQALYSALGQSVLQMVQFTPSVSYAIAVPDDEGWERQLRKVPRAVQERLKLRMYLVSPSGVRVA